MFVDTGPGTGTCCTDLLETSETFCLGPESELIFCRRWRQPRYIFTDEKADYYETALPTLLGSPFNYWQLRRMMSGRYLRGGQAVYRLGVV